MALLAVAFLISPLPEVEAQSAPPTPSAVTVTRANGTVTADWPAVSGATKYHVTYSTDNGGSWHAPVNNHTNWTSSSITFNADNAKTYVVGVRAGNDHAQWSGWRNSPASGPYTPPQANPQPPAAPAGLAASAGDGSVTVTWSNPGDSSITGYEYRSRYAGVAWSAWTAVSGSGAGTTSFTLDGLTNGTEYRVKLRAVNAHGTSKRRPPAPPPGTWRRRRKRPCRPAPPRRSP